MTSWPCISSGMNGAGGACITCVITVSSSGASSAYVAMPRTISAVAGRTRTPPRIIPTRSRRNSNPVTTPKLPPPPRNAQNSSVCDSALARTTSRSAVTSSAATMWSIVRPYLRTIQPMPPPSARPPMPTLAASPVVSASPCGWAAAAMSAEVAPGCTHAVALAASTVTPRISLISMTTPSSTTLWPARLWPPLRIESRKSCARANRIASATSVVSSAPTIIAGRRSSARLCSDRAASYAVVARHDHRAAHTRLQFCDCILQIVPARSLACTPSRRRTQPSELPRGDGRRPAACPLDGLLFGRCHLVLSSVTGDAIAASRSPYPASCGSAVVVRPWRARRIGLPSARSDRRSPVRPISAESRRGCATPAEAAATVGIAALRDGRTRPSAIRLPERAVSQASARDHRTAGHLDAPEATSRRPFHDR